MNATIKGWVVASMELAGAVGSIVAGPLADKISRRWALIVSVIILMLGTALLTGAQNTGMITAGRLVVGIAIGILANTSVLFFPLFFQGDTCAHREVRLSTIARLLPHNYGER